MKAIRYSKYATGDCEICEREEVRLFLLIIEGLKPIMVCSTCVMNICNKLGLEVEDGDAK
jgi:hypothetical protein